MDDAGNWKRDANRITGVIENYFKDIFTSTKPSYDQLEDVLVAVDRKVTEEMNASLLNAFSKEDIDRALMQMHPDKAPGSDGFSVFFFQKYWDLIGEKVSATCLNFLNDGHPLDLLNHTYVALIPKKKKAIRVAEFHPISLCNVTYKLISKVLANRLKLVLDQIISPNQRAFVPGRLITDNVVLGFECIHEIKNKRTGERGYAALKLDMSKAYDQVEWSFLDKVMERMGFHRGWIDKVMACISTVRFSFLINEAPMG